MSLKPLAILFCGLLLGADDAKQPAASRLRARVGKPIRRPAPVPVAQKFRLRVQKTSRFPKQVRPAVSKPSAVNGLEITIQPEKKEFALNGPLAFEVKLTNRSKQGLMLFGSSSLGVKPKLVVKNLKTAKQWTIQGTISPALGGDISVVLAPGKSLTLTLVAEATFVRPIPRPFPRPVPFPQPRIQLQRAVGAIQIAPAGRKPADKRPGIVVGRPVRPPFIVNGNLPCGMGNCRTQLFLEFARNPQKRKFEFPHWTGKLATATTDFNIGKPAPNFVPGQAVTKSQAIRMARPVAERALVGHYKPLKTFRPPRVGPWILSPEKTATVKKLTNGGWKVGWTHFPRSGHGYNVTVDVNSRGGAILRDVFTSYSKR
jgi:hypothetical protein